jgi:hypothetical protein
LANFPDEAQLTSAIRMWQTRHPKSIGPSVVRQSHTSKLATGVLVRQVRLHGPGLSWPFDAGRAYSMWYWFGVYALVAAAVLMALLLVYLVAAVSWLAVTTIQLIIHTLKNSRPILPPPSRHRWRMIHR